MSTLLIPCYPQGEQCLTSLGFYYAFKKSGLLVLKETMLSSV